MIIIKPEDYTFHRSEWVVLIQEVEEGSYPYEQFLIDDPDQIIESGGKKYGMRAILYFDKEHSMIQGWELINLVYDINGEERESGGTIRAELVKVIRDGTWDQELTYGDLGIGLHNFTIMNNLKEDWTDLPTADRVATPLKGIFRLLVPEKTVLKKIYDSINYQQVPQ